MIGMKMLRWRNRKRRAVRRRDGSVYKFDSLDKAVRYVWKKGLDVDVVPYNPASEKPKRLRSHHNNHGMRGTKSGTYRADMRILASEIGVEFQ